jgi:ComF family protein
VQAANLWTNCSKAILDWVYPVKCPLCGQLSDQSPCQTCVGEMSFAAPDFLEDDSPHLEFRACVYAYSGRAAQAVRELKYGRSTSLADFMAGKVAERASEVSTPRELVVPVPMHVSRASLRGFNQSILLASQLEGHEVSTTALRRIRATRPQAGLTQKQRDTNLTGAFQAVAEVHRRDVLLIDDVVTTGHTARECAKALREAGARSVGILAFAGNLD